MITNDQIFDHLINGNKLRDYAAAPVAQEALEAHRQRRAHFFGLLDLNIKEQAQDPALLAMCRAWGRELAGQPWEDGTDPRRVQQPMSASAEETREALRLASAAAVGRAIAYAMGEEEKDIPAIVWREACGDGGGRNKLGEVAMYVASTEGGWFEHSKDPRPPQCKLHYFCADGGLVGFVLTPNDHLNAALAKVGIQALPTGKPFAFYCQSWGEDDWAILGEYPAASEAKVVIEQMWQVRIPVTVKGQHLAKEQETAGAGQPTL